MDKISPLNEMHKMSQFYWLQFIPRTCYGTLIEKKICSFSGSKFFSVRVPIKIKEWRRLSLQVLSIPVHSIPIHVLTLSHSERPKLYGVLAILSAIGLSYAFQNLGFKVISFVKFSNFCFLPEYISYKTCLVVKQQTVFWFFRTCPMLVHYMQILF